MQPGDVREIETSDSTKPKMTMVQGFVTPILKCVFPNCQAINDGLRRLILEQAPPEPSVHRSNIGGWHSPNDFLKTDSPFVRQLVEWIRTALTGMTQATGGAEIAPRGEFRIVGWANVLYHGGYNKVHTHNAYAWSGVYYVDPGDEVAGDPWAGKLEFIDPRAGVASPIVPGDPFDQTLCFEPEAGQLMMFPGWLKHCVHPYKGQRPRISVAFNFSWEKSQPKTG